ncbi:hypothetical protein [Mesobacillus maritimus]|uniref:Uncharacterized protein n=1 Tax=Mesobacillus maritimus TaxID=1643336 RepID=A0ABS7K849_9BACI|nr:hypothetical protein [Mesobacillus maritimus]MBY0098434.1 hypothetical protein [Mesobacillus maritimus]
MRSYLLFFISFLALYFIIQFVSGLILTATYKPKFSETGGSSVHLSNEVALGGSLGVPFIALVILATLMAWLVVRMVRKVMGK